MVHRRRQPAARRQPGLRLVDDGGDEDRPRRPAPARARARPERGGRLPRRRRHRLRDRRARRQLRAAHRRLGRRRADRRRRSARQRASRCATPARTSRSSSAAHGDATPDAPRAFAAPSRRRACATRSCAPAARPGWSTTSTTRSPGASRRSTSPPTAPSVREIAIVAAAYPLVWGAGQLATGWLSDHTGRKPLITAGMLVQAGALGLLVAGGGAFAPSLAAAVLLGVGTAMVYPTLIAAVSDATPAARPRPRRRRLPLLARLRLRARRPDRRDRRRRHLPAGRDRDRRRAHRCQRPRRRRDLLAAATRAPTRSRPLMEVREPTFRA